MAWLRSKKKSGVVLESITNKDKIEAAILMITHVSIDNCALVNEPGFLHVSYIVINNWAPRHEVTQDSYATLLFSTSKPITKTKEMPMVGKYSSSARILVLRLHTQHRIASARHFAPHARTKRNKSHVTRSTEHCIDRI